MPRHVSVPDNQTGWVLLGVVSTDTAGFAIVAPELACELGDDWTADVLEDDRPSPEVARESVQFQEVEVGDSDTAVLFTTWNDGGYPVEGRFGDFYGDGHMSLIEVRIRIWMCCCTCHDADNENTCDGSCHDEDPPPAS